MLVLFYMLSHTLSHLVLIHTMKCVIFTTLHMKKIKTQTIKCALGNIVRNKQSQELNFKADPSTLCIIQGVTVGLTSLKVAQNCHPSLSLTFTQLWTLQVLECSGQGKNIFSTKCAIKKYKLLSLIYKQETLLILRVFSALWEQTIVPQLCFTTIFIACLIHTATHWILKVDLFIKEILKGTMIRIICVSSLTGSFGCITYCFVGSRVKSQFFDYLSNVILK